MSSYPDFMEKYGHMTLRSVVDARPEVVQQLDPPPCQFTENNHYVWNYNGVPWSKPLSPSAMFQVDIGKAASDRPADTLRNELARALTRMSDHVGGRISIPCTGTILSRVIASVCVEEGIPATQTRVHIEGQPQLPFHADLPLDHVSIKPDDVLRFYAEFREATGCNNLMVAHRVQVGMIARYPHVYLSNPPRCINLNYDYHENKACGPENWSMAFWDTWHQVAQWLCILRKPGFPFLWLDSPELIAAWFRNSVVLDYFANVPEEPRWHTVRQEIDAVASIFSLKGAGRNIRDGEVMYDELPWNQPGYIGVRASIYYRILEHGAFIPLHRVLDRVGVTTYPDHIKVGESIFGSVS